MSSKGPDKDGPTVGPRILSLPDYTLRDANLAPFFRIEDGSVFLAPEVIRYFEDILPIITEVARRIKDLIERTHEISAMPDSDEKMQAQSMLSKDVQQFVLQINVRLREVVNELITKREVVESVGTDEIVTSFLKKLDVKSRKGLRELVHRVIRIALSLKLFSSQREIAGSAHVNIGQFSVFLTRNGPLSIKKMRDVLRVILNAASEKQILDQFEAEIRKENSF